jgi:uncharacterized lipoprotein NlpE involved in copper resistance
MKKIITAILMIMTFISCNNTNKEKEEKKLMPDDIVEKNAEAFLADKLNDPTSYEFVSLKIVDTISFKQNIEEYKRMGETDMKWNEDRIEKLLDYKKTLPSLFDKDELNKQKQELVENKKMLNGIDSIETSLGEKVNQTAAYLYEFSFRGKNSLGALVINNYYLQVSAEPDFEVLNMTNETDKLLITPNGFPGLKELYSKFD